MSPVNHIGLYQGKKEKEKKKKEKTALNNEKTVPSTKLNR